MSPIIASSVIAHNRIRHENNYEYNVLRYKEDEKSYVKCFSFGLIIFIGIMMVIVVL